MSQLFARWLFFPRIPTRLFGSGTQHITPLMINVIAQRENDVRSMSESCLFFHKHVHVHEHIRICIYTCICTKHKSGYTNTNTRSHVHALLHIQPGAMKLVLCCHWMHLSYMHPVMSENQFHCTRLYCVSRYCYGTFVGMVTCQLLRKPVRAKRPVQ